MLNSEATKVARILWSLGWLHLDELKGVIGRCTKLVCLYGWRLPILHEGNQG